MKYPNKTPLLLSGLTLALSLVLSGCENEEEKDTVVFENVTVIPMTDDIELINHTVIVKDGQIHDLGPSESTSTPAGATVIDGTGRYLMPGLADMHTHPLCGAEDETCYLGQKEAEIYLAYGVTTIASMQDTSGTSQNRMKTALADRIKAGELIGPTIYTASFAGGPNDLPGVIQPSQVVTTEEEGRNHVIASKDQNYDFIKVYDGVNPEAFGGIIAQAKEENMAVIGHFTEADAKSSLIDGMDMVAHASAYFWKYFNLNPTPELIGEAIAVTAANQVYVNTTLNLQKKSVDMACANEEAYTEMLNSPQNIYANPVEKSIWRGFLYRITTFPGCTPELIANRYNVIKQYTKGFFDAGVKLVAGTDSPLVWGVPGYSTHEELEAISEIGISSYETLAIATRNAGDFVAEFLPGQETFGTVEIGKRADLLLLEANPLENLSNAQAQVGVMARGRWYTAEELEERLHAIAEEYAQMAANPAPESQTLEHPAEENHTHGH